MTDLAQPDAHSQTDGTIAVDDNLLLIGRQTLHALRHALTRDLGDDAAVCLQEAGYAAGEQIYATFLRWLPEHTGVDDPDALDADALGEVISAFFAALGWGSVTLTQIGRAGIAITSADWAEAEPSAGAALPSCYIASGLFADFVSRLADMPVAVMEVECRTRNEPHCRFLVGAPETMEAVYEAMMAGKGYASSLAD
jgi:predicted hydrocarbon binding protein